ncbi:tyrosine-type recombinase/integrase [Lignipirellula cremea]|uniref:Phage integrase family protein n=1 Tax=Lignipirellula cremea TaxID=2528010 RepID=A0A518DRJ7_9BACT|nr:tyrosine-type recombinase/integrase [Lignipirellula cremea]QDU94467.1 Phage integrase family protein [Lignipirellula cremea]
MTEPKKSRRRTRGSAWHWRQTDSWYFTPPGTKRRVRLYDEQGQPILGKENRQPAELALARLKAAGDWRPEVEDPSKEQWIVAKVCSCFIEHCQQRAANGNVCDEYRDEVVRLLNDFCGYCGALPLAELRKGHVQHWVESHPTWRSPVTRRNALTIVLAAFNYAAEMFDAPQPLRGLKKPPPRPRLHSFSPEDELSLYSATDEAFGDFLFAAIHTGLRPYSELARLTVDDIIETDRGMLWRVYASKTKKTRKIPVRTDVAELTRRRILAAQTGTETTLFQNPQGRPWKKVTGVGRFRKIRLHLGWDQDPVRQNYSTYTCRHTFAHRMLAGYWNEGACCSIEVLAELMGDTPKVAFDHYGREWGQHYQDPLWAAIGGG